MLLIFSTLFFVGCDPEYTEIDGEDYKVLEEDREKYESDITVYVKNDFFPEDNDLEEYCISYTLDRRKICFGNTAQHLMYRVEKDGEFKTLEEAVDANWITAEKLLTMDSIYEFYGLFDRPDFPEETYTEIFENQEIVVYARKNVTDGQNKDRLILGEYEDKLYYFEHTYQHDNVFFVYVRPTETTDVQIFNLKSAIAEGYLSFDQVVNEMNIETLKITSTEVENIKTFIAILKEHFRSEEYDNYQSLLVSQTFEPDYDWELTVHRYLNKLEEILSQVETLDQTFEISNTGVPSMFINYYVQVTDKVSFNLSYQDDQLTIDITKLSNGTVKMHERNIISLEEERVTIKSKLDYLFFGINDKVVEIYEENKGKITLSYKDDELVHYTYEVGIPLKDNLNVTMRKSVDKTLLYRNQLEYVFNYLEDENVHIRTDIRDYSFRLEQDYYTLQNNLEIDEIDMFLRPNLPLFYLLLADSNRNTSYKLLEDFSIETFLKTETKQTFRLDQTKTETLLTNLTQVHDALDIFNLYYKETNLTTEQEVALNEAINLLENYTLGGQTYQILILDSDDEWVVNLALNPLIIRDNKFDEFKTDYDLYQTLLNKTDKSVNDYLSIISQAFKIDMYTTDLLVLTEAIGLTFDEESALAHRYDEDGFDQYIDIFFIQYDYDDSFPSLTEEELTTMHYEDFLLLTDNKVLFEDAYYYTYTNMTLSEIEDIYPDLFE